MMKKQKARALSVQQNVRLRSKGFARSRGGYIIPGVSQKDIENAAKLQKILKKNKGLKPPSDPKINLSPLTPKGGVNVAFTQPMLAPKKGTTFNPKIYNSVMDIEIESKNDQSTFKGAFGESKKRSLATQEESGEASKIDDIRSYYH